MNRLLTSILLLATGLGFLQGPAEQTAAAAISLNPSVTYQTISGWEATAQSGAIACQSFDRYSGVLFDQAVNDLGINRIRLEIASGTENPVDYFTMYMQGLISQEEMHSHRYEIINDNGDPNQIDPGGFQFAHLDFTIDHVITPLRQLLAARGESLYVNINYIDFGGSTFEHQTRPQEYAEFAQAIFQHIQGKYGWMPDAWEVLLEPENTSWSAAQMGNAIAAAGARLQALGYTPDFIAPSTTNMGNAVSFFDQLIQVPGVLPYLDMISYHRYVNASLANLQAIAQRGQQYGLDTAMLEHIGSDYQDLHQDLKIGRNSAWQQYVLAYCTNSDDGSAYYRIDETSLENPQVILGSRTKFLRQYFKTIRRGAVRIEAASNNSLFDPLAFINPNGAYVVVVKASQAGTMSIQSLPAGRYGVFYTTASQYNVQAGIISVASGKILNTSIPAAGVITVFALGPADQKLFLPVVRK